MIWLIERTPKGQDRWEICHGLGAFFTETSAKSFCEAWPVDSGCDYRAVEYVRKGGSAVVFSIEQFQALA